MSNTAQGSIKISRMRNGDTVTTVLQLNGKPLYQFIDSDSGAPSPNWKTDADKRPTITPVCYSSRAQNVPLQGHTWFYNDAQIVFGTADADGYCTDTTGKFKKKESTGALTIIDNLASASNTTNDTLTYKGTAVVNAISVNAEVSATIVIQQGGASSWHGWVTATPQTLTSTETTSKLETGLTLGGEEQTDYYVKWKKGGSDGYITKWNGMKAVTVERDDVDGITTFVAEFYKSSADTEVVERAAASVTDNTDEFRIEFRYGSDNTEVDENKPVKLTAFVQSMRMGTEVTSLTGASWSLRIMDGETWEQIGDTVNTPSVEISTAHTDYTDDSQVLHQRDVVLLADVSFS